MSSHEMPGYAIAATDGHHARLDERGYVLLSIASHCQITYLYSPLNTAYKENTSIFFPHNIPCNLNSSGGLIGGLIWKVKNQKN